MSLYCRTFFRRKSFGCYRLLSTYVTKARYLFELKEDEEACRKAQKTGVFYLFHDLDPLLQASGHRYLVPRLSRAELEGLLGESVEETVHREVAEEVGLEVENIQYSASQHWPFPNSSLMIACHATVKPGHTEIQVNLKELEAAAWFSLDEVTTALRRKGSLALQPSEASPLLLPPKLAIAHHLIKKWVETRSCSSLAA